jgi:uncharacterized protein YabE (DUF348 family)
MPNWTKGLAALALLVSLVVSLVLGLVRTGAPLTIVVNGQQFGLRTHAATVRDALQRAGVALYPEDRVSPGLDSELHPGVVVRVDSAKPIVLHVGGVTQGFRTHTSQVGEFLEEAGVQLGPADQIWLDGQEVEDSAALWDRTLPAGQEQGITETAVSAGASAPGSVPELTVRRATSLVLVDNGTLQPLHTTLDTVGQALQQHGVSIYLGDRVEPGIQERVSSGMTVTIHRSVPVQIKVDGRTIDTRTRAEDVAGALGQESVALVGKDRVEPPLSTPIREGQVIRVVRMREEILVEFEPIPFETQWVPDPEVEIDNIRLVQEGQPGLTKRRIRVVYQDDQEVERYLEDVWTEMPPVTKTMAYGTKIVIRTLETPDGPVEYWRKIRVYTTSYTAATCGKPRDHPRYGYTRLGLWLVKGIVATDPTVIPLKTRMYVPGYGYAFAGDTGGGVKGKWVDLGYDEDNYRSWHWWTDVYLRTPVPPADQIRWILPDWPRFPDRRR